MNREEKKPDLRPANELSMVELRSLMHVAHQKEAKAAHEIFDNFFATVTDEFTFPKAWLEGRPLDFEEALDGKHALVLEPGKFAKVTGPNEWGGLRAIFLGTVHGPVVVFEYPDPVLGRFCRFAQAKNFRQIYPLPMEGKMTAANIDWLFGLTDGKNIGELLD